MTTGLLTTTLGQAAIATDLAGGADLVLSHVGFGDSNGVPYAPNESQVALVNEKYRATIASVAVVAGAIVVDAVIPADTPDGAARPSHGFNIAEAGLFSSAGTLIGVARMSNGYKPPPSSGQAAIATYRFKLPVANPSAISVVIDPQAQVQLGRNVRPFWMTVDGWQNAPPPAPAIGETYIIGSVPTGAWAGFANRLAQWVGVWALASVPDGHIVRNRGSASSSQDLYLQRTSTGWGSAAATETSYGFSRLATAAELLLGTAGLAVGADKWLGAFTSLPIHAEVKTADARFTVTAGAGNVVVTGATVTWRGWKDLDLTGLTAPNRTLATAASKTYHLRWDAPGTGLAVPIATYPLGRLSLRDVADGTYNPGALAETAAAFDTTFDSVLIARVVTNGANVATITTLANRSRLSATISRPPVKPTPDFYLAHAVSWGRMPACSLSGLTAPGGNRDTDPQIYLSTADRYAVSVFASGWSDEEVAGTGGAPSWGYSMALAA